MGITKNGAYDILKRKYLKPDAIEKISQVLAVHPSDFIEYEFPSNIQEKLASIGNSKESFAEKPKGNIIFVPIKAQGGFLTGYSNKVFMDTLERFFLPGVYGEHYAFEVDGMSMYDIATPGDWAIASEIEKLEYMVKGKTYVLQTIDGILIKKFNIIRDGKAIFLSHNQEFGAITLPLKAIKKVYYVAHILKKI